MGKKITKTFRFPYCIEESHLIAIRNAFINHVGPITMEAQCIDGRTRTFSNLDELRLYDNNESQRIIRLTMQAANEEEGKRALISFDTALVPQVMPDEPLYVELEGSIEMIKKLKQQLTAIMLRMRPWYTTITNMNLYFLVPLITIFFILMFASNWGLGTRQILIDLVHFDISFSMSLVIGLIFTAFIAYGMRFLVAYLFPFSVISLGEQLKRYKKDGLMRSLFLIAEVVFFVVGIVTFR